MEVFGVPKKIEDLTQGSHTKKNHFSLRKKHVVDLEKVLQKLKVP